LPSREEGRASPRIKKPTLPSLSEPSFARRSALLPNSAEDEVAPTQEILFIVVMNAPFLSMLSPKYIDLFPGLLPLPVANENRKNDRSFFSYSSLVFRKPSQIPQPDSVFLDRVRRRTFSPFADEEKETFFPPVFRCHLSDNNSVPPPTGRAEVSWPNPSTFFGLNSGGRLRLSFRHGPVCG